MSFTQNRFGALLGEEETEIDKLGNVKPVEKKGDAQPPTRKEVRRGGFRQPAGKKKKKRRVIYSLLIMPTYSLSSFKT